MVEIWEIVVFVVEIGDVVVKVCVMFGMKLGICFKILDCWFGCVYDLLDYDCFCYCVEDLLVGIVVIEIWEIECDWFEVVF